MPDFKCIHTKCNLMTAAASRNILIRKPNHAATKKKIICFSLTTSVLLVSVVLNVKSQFPLWLRSRRCRNPETKKPHIQTCKHTLRRRQYTINRKGRAQKHHYLISSSACSVSASPCSSLWGLNSLTSTEKPNPHYRRARRRQSRRPLTRLERLTLTSTSSQIHVCVCVCVSGATLWLSGAIVAAGPSRLLQDMKQWESQRFIMAPGLLMYLLTLDAALVW